MVTMMQAIETDFRGLVIFGYETAVDGFEVVDWDTLHDHLIDQDGWRRRDFRRSKAAGFLHPRLHRWISENWGVDMIEALETAPA